MLGHTALRGANIWIETTAPAYATIKFWQEGKHDNPHYQYARVLADNYNMHTFKLKGLEPGLSYQYQLWVDKQAV
ncbi:MAG TPA: hypothetical protein ENJ41_01575, partial [Oceanospirillales bacterium]|nr:hypothetical protein [Oceanospirillales bacterium]